MRRCDSVVAGDASVISGENELLCVRLVMPHCMFGMQLFLSEIAKFRFSKVKRVACTNPSSSVLFIHNSQVGWYSATPYCLFTVSSSRFSTGRLDGNLPRSWTKLNCESAPFTNARINAFTITFIRQKYVRSVHVRPKCERVQAQHRLWGCAAGPAHNSQWELTHLLSPVRTSTEVLHGIKTEHNLTASSAYSRFSADMDTHSRRQHTDTVNRHVVAVLPALIQLVTDPNEELLSYFPCPDDITRRQSWWWPTLLSACYRNSAAATTRGALVLLQLSAGGRGAELCVLKTLRCYFAFVSSGVASMKVEIIV